MRILFMFCLILLACGLISPAKADFILYDNEQLTVNSSIANGYLFDSSIAFIINGGSVNRIFAYNSSTVNMSGGIINDLLQAYDTASINITNGTIPSLTVYDNSITNISENVSVQYIIAYASSIVNISGGNTYSLSAHDYTTTNITGGVVRTLNTNCSGVINISGGSIENLNANNSSISIINIYGGTIHSFTAAFDSTAKFYGRNFHCGSGLALEGNRVSGNGILSCEWGDGTRCAVNINCYHTATILCESVDNPPAICVAYPTMDFNKDCRVNLLDFAVFAQSWLECNLEPQSACLE